MVDASSELRIEIALLQCQVESERDNHRQLQADHESEKSRLLAEWESRERKHAMESEGLKAYILHLEEVVAAKNKAIHSMASEQAAQQSNQASDHRNELSRIEQECADKEMRLKVVISDQKENIKELEKMNEYRRSHIEHLSLSLEHCQTTLLKRSDHFVFDISCMTTRHESTVGLLTDELEQSLLHATNLDAKNVNLHTDLIHARKSILELKRQFSNLQQNLESDFDKKKSLLGLQVETLTRRLQVSEQSCRNLASENSDLVSRIDQLEIQAKKFDKNEVESMMKQITDLNAKVRDKDFELRLMQREHQADLLAHKAGYKLLADENNKLLMENHRWEKSNSENIERVKEVLAESGSVDKLLMTCMCQLEELGRTLNQREREISGMQERIDILSQVEPKKHTLGLRILDEVVIQSVEEVAGCEDSEAMVELSRMVDVMRREIESLNAARIELTEKFNQAVNRENTLLAQKTDLENHLREQGTVLNNVIVLLCSAGTMTRHLESDFVRNSSIIQTLNDKCCAAEQSMFFQRKSHAEELTSIQLQLLREKESVVNDLERRLLMSRYE
jgi:hypothetical protein